MANDHVKLDIINEKHKDVDTEAIEIVFGRPAAPAQPKNTLTNNVHLINNERGHHDMHFVSVVLLREDIILIIE